MVTKTNGTVTDIDSFAYDNRGLIISEIYVDVIDGTKSKNIFKYNKLGLLEEELDFDDGVQDETYRNYEYDFFK